MMTTVFQDTPPRRWTMEVVLLMKRLMYFLTKRQKVFSPANASPEVGIIGIELEPDVTGQTIEHRIHHVVYLNEQATVNADMVNHPPTEGLINPPIGHYIQLFHTCS